MQDLLSQSFYDEENQDAASEPQVTERQLLDELLLTDEAWNAAVHARDPLLLSPLLSDAWVGFLPDGQVVFKTQMLKNLAQQPPALLLFERQACRVHHHTGITRGVLYVGGQAVQGYMRVYAWGQGRWQAVSVQLVGV